MASPLVATGGVARKGRNASPARARWNSLALNNSGAAKKRLAVALGAHSNNASCLLHPKTTWAQMQCGVLLQASQQLSAMAYRTVEDSKGLKHSLTWTRATCKELLKRWGIFEQ